jgi:DNA-binding transcriptional LysR family regulator
MTEIDPDDIRRLDGGLLLVFRELARRGQTTAVAAHLGLSQSAVSHALGRLRDIFGDRLFLRRPHGLTPTARALELAPRIDALIDLMGAALRPDPTFDGARSSRWFRVGLTEYAGEALAARLAARLRATAPGVGFTLHFLRGYVALDALQRGQLDLALGRFETAPAGFEGEPLFEDRYCVAVRRGHPTIQGAITATQWRATGHVFVSSSSNVDNVIGPAIGEDAMPSPNAVVTAALAPRWETALAMVAASDLIGTHSRRIAEQHPLAAQLQLLEPPDAMEAWEVAMARREGPDAGLDWFMGEVRAVALPEAPSAS